MFRLRRSEPRYLRCAVTLLTLVSFVVAAIPVPLPVVPPASAAASGDEPFPCQGSRCGCRSAKQCWTACCCRKPSERKRWAEEGHIQPPAYAILQDAGAPAQTAAPAAPAVRRCCAVVATCSAPPTPAPVESCCATADSAAVGTSSHERDDADYVLMIRAMECRGLGFDLSAIAWFYWLPVVPVAYERDFETLVFRPVDDEADSFSLDPATPPPRCG